VSQTKIVFKFLTRDSLQLEFNFILFKLDVESADEISFCPNPPPIYYYSYVIFILKQLSLLIGGINILLMVLFSASCIINLP